jgi:biotin carboxyl carrier protein
MLRFSNLLVGLTASLVMQSTFALDVKGIEVDFAAKLKTPADASCVQMQSQPRDGSAQFPQAREQFIFSLKKGEPVTAPAPGVVVRDSAGQMVVFHGTDALGNNVLSAFSKAMDKALVAKGQFVKRGQPLGEASSAGTGYFSAMVSGNTSAQPFLDSVFQLARASNVPASYFLFPLRTTAGKSESTELAKFDPAKDYGDGEWDKANKFTGFTFPFSCGAGQQ